MKFTKLSGLAVAVSAAALCAVFAGTASSQEAPNVTSVTPAVGTIGDTITIGVTNYTPGRKLKVSLRPAVAQKKRKPATVIKLSRAKYDANLQQITAEIRSLGRNADLIVPNGNYDLLVDSRGNETLVGPSGFRLGKPFVDDVTPKNPVPGDKVTISGGFFGSQRYTVEVGGQVIKGKKKLDWTNSTLCFELPKKVDNGCQSILVRHPVCYLEAGSSLDVTGGRDSPGKKTRVTATVVDENGRLCNVKISGKLFGNFVPTQDQFTFIGGTKGKASKIKGFVLNFPFDPDNDTYPMKYTMIVGPPGTSPAPVIQYTPPGGLMQLPPIQYETDPGSSEWVLVVNGYDGKRVWGRFYGPLRLPAARGEVHVLGGRFNVGVPMERRPRPPR